MRQVQASFKGFKASVKGLTALTQREVRIGVLDASAHSEGITNAQLLTIHEFGSRANNIPERSVLRTTIAESRAEVASILVDGITQGAPRALEAAGRLVQVRVKAKFGSARLKRAKQPDTNGPLYDTGKLKRAIRYKVVPVGGET